MLIYVPKITSRVKYVFNLLFKEMFGLDFRITENKAFFESYHYDKLNYSESPYLSEPFVKSSGLLFENAIEQIEPEFLNKGDVLVIFPTPCELGFDIFSAIFFMVSRYEEYISVEYDEFNRFKAVNSFAHKHNFLHLPIVNIWANELQIWLLRKFPDLTFKTNKFSSIVTYDIDVAYAFKGRGFWRNITGFIKDILLLRLKNFSERAQVIFEFKKDPWDIYENLLHQLHNYKLRSIFFFLVGPYSAHNKNLSIKNRYMKNLIKCVESVTELGIHPSFNSSLNENIISNEKMHLNSISSSRIVKSRQHYLKFKLPETYNYLIKSGICEEYSMGFPEMPGFRASICTPFYFYDLKNEISTNLKVFPLAVMDGSLIKYLKLSPLEGYNKICKLIDEVKKVNGLFISLWHNHTISDEGEFLGWKNVHDKMIEKLFNEENQI